MMKKILAISLFSAAVGAAYAQLPLIPYPHVLTEGEGALVITAGTTMASDKAFSAEASTLNQLFGGRLEAGSTIRLKVDSSLTRPEAYTLDITREGILIRAKDPAGAFHAIETIRQLLPLQGPLRLPVLHIEDYPAYSWRGMHLDVSRHFLSITYLQRFIDRMALYKMNKLHLHLSDDQGWRIEIKKYPKLTDQGAWRVFNSQDSACMRQETENPDMAIDPAHIIHRDGKTLYGGFYTQAELKSLVAYAAARHVDIIPEIDMPGHMMAAINAYPYLTCNGENTWGTLFTKPICPCNDSTFAFAEDIFTEVMDIFPSTYIHIGGDEVDRSDWAKSAACQILMKKEGIKDLAGLQSYFINRMERFFQSRGRKLIGWDEIIEGGISPSALVMYWRTWVPHAPIAAAANGNQVVMAPGEPLYFDRPADAHDLYHVYHFNPIPKGLPSSEDPLIIGAQACLWSEMIPSEQRMDFMSMPRMTALAEALWTNDPGMFDAYQARLVKQYPLMDAMGVHYRLPDIPGLLNHYVFVKEGRLSVQNPLDNLIFRYTVDSTIPGPGAPLLPDPLLVRADTRIKVAAFAPGGNRGDVYTLDFARQPMLQPENRDIAMAGLNCAYYKAGFRATTYMDKSQRDSVFSAYSVAVPDWVNAPAFGLRFRGFINVPEDGTYTFYLTCDDGGVLTIGPYTTVDNDGNHSARERSGQVALRKGPHSFGLDFIEAGGGFKLSLQYSVNGSKPTDIPSGWFER